MIEFNQGGVDGELMRVPVVEEHYYRTFVRSDKPVLVDRNSLWVHPDGDALARFPIAYQYGVSWQQQYIDQIPRTMRFYSNQDIFEAYKQQRVRGFLASDDVVEALVEAGELWPVPVAEDQVRTLELYHYLGREYSPFMKRLNNLLQKSETGQNN